MHRAAHVARERRAYWSLVGAIISAILLVLMVWSGTHPEQPAATGNVDLVIPAGTVQEMGQWCVDHNTAAFRRTLSTAGKNTLAGCVELWGAGLTPSPTGSPSPTGTPTPSPTATATTPPPTTTAPPTTTPPATTPAPTSTPAPTPTPTGAGGFPDSTNTGVPAGTVLATYTGPCVITVVGTIIDSKMIGCNLSIQTTGVEVRRSAVLGTVAAGSGSGDAGAGVSLSLIDTEVTCSAGQTCVGESRFTLTRANIHGGNRQAHCYAWCTIQDSWLHGTRLATNDDHASGARFGQHTTIIHNTIVCDAPNPPTGTGGCSADLTGYPDFEPVHDVLVQGNLFPPASGAWFEAYGGWETTKPYNSDPTNATYIVYRGNTFTKYWPQDLNPANPPITSFVASRTGNLFTGNVWTDGSPVTL